MSCSLLAPGNVTRKKAIFSRTQVLVHVEALSINRSVSGRPRPRCRWPGAVIEYVPCGVPADICTWAPMNELHDAAD